MASGSSPTKNNISSLRHMFESDNGSDKTKNGRSNFGETKMLTRAVTSHGPRQRARDGSPVGGDAPISPCRPGGFALVKAGSTRADNVIPPSDKPAKTKSPTFTAHKSIAMQPKKGNSPVPSPKTKVRSATVNTKLRPNLPPKPKLAEKPVNFGEKIVLGNQVQMKSKDKAPVTMAIDTDVQATVEEPKPCSVAERAQIFSSEEPKQESALYRPKRRPSKTDALQELVGHQWEAADREDNEGDQESDKLSQSANSSSRLPRNHKGSGVGKVKDQETLPQLSKKTSTENGKKPQPEAKPTPAPSGFQRVIPKWFRKNRMWFSRMTGGGRTKDPQPVASSSLEPSSMGESSSEVRLPVEKPHVHPDATLTISKPLPAIPKSATVSGCQVSEQHDAQEALRFTTDGSSQEKPGGSSAMADGSNQKAGSSGSLMLPPLGRPSKAISQSPNSWCLPRLPNEERPLQVALPESKTDMKSGLSATPQDKSTDKKGNTKKALADIHVEVPSPHGLGDEKPTIILSHFIQGKERLPKLVPDVSSEEAPVSYRAAETDVACQVINKPTCGPMIQKPKKPPPKPPSRGLPSSTASSRREESTSNEQKVSFATQVEYRSLEARDSKMEKDCTAVSEPIDVENLSPTKIPKLPATLSKDPQGVEGSLVALREETRFPDAKEHSPDLQKPIPDVPQSPECTQVQKSLKPVPVARQRVKQQVAAHVDGNGFKQLPNILEESPPDVPKPMPRASRPWKPNLDSSGESHCHASPSTHLLEEATPQEIQDVQKEDTSVPKKALTKDAHLSKESGIPESDSDNASTLERKVIPLRQIKLLEDEFASKLAARSQRTSSLEDLSSPAVLTVAFSNARGLFQRAQLMKSCESLNTPKPPIAQKPQLFKKPSPSDIPGGASSPSKKFPIVSSSPPRTRPKPRTVNLKSTKSPSMDNIYDEVYSEQTGLPSDSVASIDRERSHSKKLEKILGPGCPSGDQATPDAATQSTKSVKEKAIKFSTPAKSASDREGPYAVIPLPDADKTATKKTKNPAEQKTRKISDGNGNSVVLRNSGGMSSGDSGIGNAVIDKVGISRKERRMSRRMLREKMRSIDSDFTEDSDDEPIGAESDFDSDTSVEEPTIFLDESHKKAYEVLTTERKYVETLYLINQIFLAQIQAENQKQHWFPQTALNEIFSNVTSIYQLHSAVLLPELEKRLKEWHVNPRLGEALKKVAPFLKLYSDYVSNFDHAMKQLNLWSFKVPKFTAALAEMQKHPLCGNLTLQHHMLTPIQRIPRYELLLKEYLRKLPADSDDRADADKALIIISGAAQHSNDMMKSMDQFEKLLKINEKIDGENIIDPTRHLLKEGKLTKIGNKNKEPQDRYIFLFNDILLCCEKKRLLTYANYKVKLRMDVDGMMVLDSNGCRFIIESKGKSIEFQANSEEDREDWMREMILAVNEMTRKKESFKMNDAVADRQNGVGYESKNQVIPGKVEPRWIRDDETTMCMRCGTDFKLTKRRHHCRACGAVVCSKCSSFEAPLEYDDNKTNRVCVKCYSLITGDDEEIKKLARRSLIIEIDEEKSFGSFLYVHLKGAWIKFWVVVTEQDLFVLKAPKDVRSVITIPIQQYSVRDISDSDAERHHVFRLSSGRTVYTLSAESKEVKRRWMSILTQGIKEISRRSLTF